jgi:hypothetical protein
LPFPPTSISEDESALRLVELLFVLTDVLSSVSINCLD